MFKRLFDNLFGKSVAREAEPVAAPRCKEDFTNIPFTSDHVWMGDLHGNPTGLCLRCGITVNDWNSAMVRRISIQSFPSQTGSPVNFGMTNVLRSSACHPTTYQDPLALLQDNTHLLQ
jgi:hypothetical protein